MKTESDLEKHCRAQFGRMAHWRGCPEAKEAIQDYLKALARLETKEAVTKLVDELVAAEWISFPSLSAINAMIYERMQEIIKRRRDCVDCGGMGMVTIWKLVTYRGNSFTIQSAKTITVPQERDISLYEYQREVAMALPSLNEPSAPGVLRQAVLSAAQDCACGR